MNRPKLLLLGASGHLGGKIAEALTAVNYHTIAVVRSKQKGEALKPFIAEYRVLDILNLKQVPGITKGISVIVSALGKSVSPNTNDKLSFYQVDYKANSAVLQDAIKNGVQKFVYVSALGAEVHQDLEYFRAHHLFSTELMASGINYSILQPPALFSAFGDLMEMAKKGRLLQIGNGNKKTNPIDESDLAAICVEAISAINAIDKLGGRLVYTRRQITDIIQQAIAPDKKVRTVPSGLVKAFLPLLKMVNKNLYDKVAFFIRVMEEDTIADKVGAGTLEDYLSKYKAA